MRFFNQTTSRIAQIIRIQSGMEISSALMHPLSIVVVLLQGSDTFLGDDAIEEVGACDQILFD